MPVYLDIESRIDERAAAAAARKLIEQFSHVGNQISRDMVKSLSGALAAVDGRAARAQLIELQAEYRRLADIEDESARRMVRSMAQVEVAQKRLNEVTDKYGADSSRAASANVALADSHARAAKAQRDQVDAMVASEAAHARLGRVSDLPPSTLRHPSDFFEMRPIANAVAIGSVAAFGTAAFEAGKKAGDFQQQIIRLQASAGETGANLKTVSDGILNLAGQVGYSASDLATGMYTVEKAGYRGGDGLKVLQSAAQLAKAENADLGEVLNGLTTSMNDYNIPVSKAADLASKLNVAVGMAKTTLQDFSGALHSVEPAAMIAHVGIDQVYGDLARLTQSGMSPDQGSQNLAQTIRNFMGPNAQMRDALGKLGLSAHQLQVEMGDPSVGLNGVLKQVSDRIRSLAGPDGQVALSTFYKNVDATNALNTAYQALSPQAKGIADQLNQLKASGATAPSGLLKELRTEAKIDPQLQQWMAMRTTVDGLSSNLKKLQPDLETVQQLFKETTGGTETLNVLAQLYGTPEDAQKTADAVNQVGAATADADGKVKGFSEAQKGLNAQMSDAKAAFGAAAIKLGDDFIPALTSAARGLLDVANLLEQHPGLAEAAATAVGLFGGAWLVIKGYNIASTVVGPIATGIGTLITRLGEARSALAAFGAAGIAAQLGGQYAQDHTSGFWHGAAVVGTDVGTGAATGAVIGSIIPGVGTVAGAGVGALIGGGVGLYNQIEGHTAGGPLHAPGPKGTDSALFWGADGEHVLSADDVDAAGGHPGVYAWRAALHRQDGGPVGDDGSPMSRLYQEAEALNGGNYVRGSTDCSGAVSQLVDAALGTTGRMSTATASSWLTEKGFQSGFQPGAFNVGWYNGGPGGGHMAATLPDGTHFESGGQHGGIELGGDAAGAESSEFTNHMYLPMQGLYPDGPAGSGGMGGESPKMAAANDRLTRAQEHLSVAKQHESEVDAEPKAKASTRERAKDEVADAERQVAAAERERAAAIRQGSSGGGRGGSPFLPVPLADRFGLSKGLPGIAEWAVGFMEDMVLGPLETGVMAAFGQSPGGQSGGLLGMLSGGGGGFGRGPDVAAPFTPDVPPGTFGPGSAGGAPAAGAGAGTGEGAGAAANPAPAATSGDDSWGGIPPGATPPSAAVPPAAAPTPNIGQPFPLPTDPAQWGTPPRSATPAPSPLWGLLTGQLPGTTGPGLLMPSSRQQEFLKSFHDLPQTTAPSPSQIMQMPGPWAPAQHFATGGPIGTDTVPAWLSPGEEVERTSAVRKYGQPFMDRLNAGQVDPKVRYFSGGGGVPAPAAPPPAPPPAPAPPPKAPPPPPKPPQEAIKAPTTPPVDKPNIDSTHAGSPLPGGKPEGDQTHAGLKTPAANEQLFGQGQPASQGLGFGGGLIGAAEGAASQAAGPGSSGAQLAFQMVNRTAGYFAQVAGIGVEALLETFLPADSPLSNFSNTLPGKLLSGVAGVRPAEPNAAGKTRAPLTSHESGSTQGSRASSGDQYHFHEGAISLKTDNFEKSVGEISDQALRSQHNSAANWYQFSRTP